MVTYIFLSFSILVESEKSNDKKRLVFGDLPKLNLPQRSHEESRHKTCRKRKERTDVINLNNKKKNGESESYFYHSFKDVCVRLPKLKTLIINKWNIEIKVDRVILKKFERNLVLPKNEILIDDSMRYTCSIFVWFLPDDHNLYKKCKRCICNVNVLHLIYELENSNICCDIQKSESSTFHIVPLSIDPLM